LSAIAHVWVGDDDDDGLLEGDNDVVGFVDTVGFENAVGVAVGSASLHIGTSQSAGR